MISLSRLHHISLVLVVMSCLPNETAANSKYEVDTTFILDYDRYDPFFSDEEVLSTSKTEVRRFRVSFKFKHSDAFLSKIQLNFDPDTSKIEYKDVYISYTGLEDFLFRIGQEKEPLGLENTTSLRKLQSIERSLATQAITPGRGKGVSIAMNKKNWFWKLGHYELKAKNKELTPTAVTGRMGWSQLYQDNFVIHAAIAGSNRKLLGEKYKINERIEVHTSDSVVEGKSIKASKVRLRSAELLLQRQEISLVSEYLESSVLDTNGRTRDYRGVYWQLGYRLTGEAFQYKKGKFGGLIITIKVQLN